MIRILLRLFVTCAVLLSLLAGGALAFSWLGAEARGAVPLERLARRGSALERHVARMVAGTLAAGPTRRTSAGLRGARPRRTATPSACGSTAARTQARWGGCYGRSPGWWAGRTAWSRGLHKPGIAVR